MISQIKSIDMTPSYVLAPGATVGHYVIESVLGEGGMGLVFLGRHIDLDMKVAIKTVRPELAADERIVSRLMDEARAVASLRSDHVVRVFDVARLPDGAPYLVFELVDGPDLDRVLAADGPMSVRDAVSAMLDVCLGLAEAHRRGIVHRDIKPENLLREMVADGTWRVKISDFGIAKRSMGHRDMSRTQQSGSVGSPWYMAPEQMMNSRDVDQRVDVWSVGVVLFELLTGAVPFPGDSPAEVCARVMTAPPLSVREIRADVPESLEAIIGRCLRRERGLRYPDVGELAAMLATVVPELEGKARGVAARLGAIDVVLGRTLASLPALRPEMLSLAPVPTLPSVMISLEQDEEITLHTIPGGRRRWPLGAIAAGAMACALFIAFHRHDVRTWAHARIDALVGAKDAPANAALVPVLAPQPSRSAVEAAPEPAEVQSPEPMVAAQMNGAVPEGVTNEYQVAPIISLPALVVTKARRDTGVRARTDTARPGDYFVPADGPYDDVPAPAAAPTIAPTVPVELDPADEMARREDRAATPLEPFADHAATSAE